MSQGSGCGVLDCSDSPLSITANVIGILTLAYAIFITFVYRGKALASAKEEQKDFNEQARRAHRSLVDGKERLSAYFSTLGLPMSNDIKTLLADAESWNLRYHLSDEGKLSVMLPEEAAYLAGKEGLNRVLEGMLRTSAILHDTYHVLLNSLIMDEIRKQRAAFEEQARVASKQIAMLDQIMNTFGIKMPTDSSEDPDDQVKDGPIDMIGMYLRTSAIKQERPPPKYVRVREQVNRSPQMPPLIRVPDPRGPDNC